MDFGMQLVVHDQTHQAVAAAATRVTARLREDPALVLGLATGGTMEAVYARLVAAHRAGGPSFAQAQSFNLDEYIGLGPAHPQSYAAFMRRHLFGHVDFAPGATHLPDGTAADPEAEAKAYEALIRARGPIGLQLLGIGTNGHIGFNEPGSARTSRSRVVALDESTVAANSRFFAPGEMPPARAITMGIATILDAQEIVLLATGAAKAAAVAAMLEGPVGPDCPASMLRGHAAVTVILDAAAAAGLAGRDDQSRTGM